MVQLIVACQMQRLSACIHLPMWWQVWLPNSKVRHLYQNWSYIQHFTVLSLNPSTLRYIPRICYGCAFWLQTKKLEKNEKLWKLIIIYIISQFHTESTQARILHFLFNSSGVQTTWVQVELHWFVSAPKYSKYLE